MESKPNSSGSGRFWEFLALVISVAALAGSLYLSIGMKLKACPFCLYERTFMMGVVGVLLMGLFRGRDEKGSFAALLALPLAIGGLGVAGFHVYLEITEVLECPDGVFGILSAPQQSLVAFVLVTILLAVALNQSAMFITGFGAVILGALFCYGSIKSAPPLPKAPTQPYATPMEGCRPMFKEDKKADDKKADDTKTDDTKTDDTDSDDSNTNDATSDDQKS